jgi:hypothetical protein
LRKIQSYDWSDEYLKRGNDSYELKNYEKALEQYKDAEKLDFLNNKISILKAKCYIKLVNNF